MRHSRSKSGSQDRNPPEERAAEIRTAAARLVADRVRQGLPAKVEDPVALARIATILAGIPAASPEDTIAEGVRDSGVGSRALPTSDRARRNPRTN